MCAKTVNTYVQAHKAEFQNLDDGQLIMAIPSGGHLVERFLLMVSRLQLSASLDLPQREPNSR